MQVAYAGCIDRRYRPRAGRIGEYGKLVYRTYANQGEAWAGQGPLADYLP